ncbi:acyl-CoA dehydrogenase family protein [Paraconexibacter antarcticus]|uniref:Acyl-CoA dehydrogenase family protein n=1 Tax=Paraconexibacter antarcticus TaxID=2949664 RepID=A0ABY5DWI8_9ACTN|nr:acyl-CoA dehydrogenase [Paraconexibacter antarcticus]UTI66366.1 acyl-CoA dehydrogenase family protein [Paraconexibacter antarcticus]
MSTVAAGPTLDAVALRRWLDGEHREIREQVRERLVGLDLAQADGISRAEYRELVLGWATELGRSGETALGFPRRYGGEANIAGSIASFETMAHGDLSLLVKCGVQFGLFGGAILQLGTERHHDEYLRGVIDVTIPGCFAMSESAHGSDVQNVHTTATYDPATHEFVVHTPHDGAHKEWIGNAATHGRVAVVFAQLITGEAQESYGVHAVVVPIRDADGNPTPGVRIDDCGDKMGLQGVDNGRLWFDQVRVPREALLDRFASVAGDGTYTSAIENPDRRFFTMLGTLVQGRVSVGGAAISVAKNALTIAIRHALRRRQFTAPDGEEILLLDYRTHQRRLLPLLARTYALHAAQEQLVAKLDAAFSGDVGERARRELEAHAAGIKALSTWHGSATVQACREACGGLGYLSENRFASLKGDSEIFTTFEGDNTVLLQLVGKSLLTGYKDQFGDLDPLGMVGFVAGQALKDVVEKTAVRQVAQTLVDVVVPARDDDSEMLDRGEQLLLLRYRSERVLASVARRLERGIDEGHPAFEVFRACQDHVLAAARAEIECVIGEAFAARVAACEDPVLKLHMERLCDLHLLSTIEADRAWYLEHGRLSPSRAKTLTRTVNRILNEVRADAWALVDAFGIPDAVLRAPIGLLDQADRTPGL